MLSATQISFESLSSILASIRRYARIRLAQAVFPILFRPDLQIDMIRLGSHYGGWWIPTEGLNADSKCYLAGVGTDITFDKALIDRLGCSAWGMDPTPKSIIWFNDSVGYLEGYRLLPWGLAGISGSIKFYSPRDPAHVSHSIKNLQRTDSFFVADVKTVRQVMIDLDHQTIDLLKVDIEGAEHDTLRAMIADGILPYVICVEFDQPEPIAWSIGTVKVLRRAGYRLAKVDTFNFTFVHAPSRIEKSRPTLIVE